MSLLRRAVGTALAALATVSMAPPARAIVLAEDEFEETSTDLGAIVRGFTFVLAGDVLEPPYNVTEASPTGLGLLDLRLYFSHSTPDFKLVVHDHLTTELRTHALSSPLMIAPVPNMKLIGPVMSELSMISPFALQMS